jgi:molecular chaperone GrpE
MSDEAQATEQAAGQPTADETLEQQVLRLHGELNEAKDRALRATAEIENVRKRFRREQEDDRKYAETLLLGDLLPVVDNLQRALASAEKNPDAAGLQQGVKLVAQQLEGVLNKHHCKRIDAQDKPFDPNLHAAIQQVPAPGKPANTVVMVAQEGYQLHERVLRPSQVIVSAADQQAAQQQ